MRYMLAILALGLSVSTLMPAAFASERDGHDVSVAATTAQVGPSDTGTIAGPTGPVQNPVEHDLNRN